LAPFAENHADALPLLLLFVLLGLVSSYLGEQCWRAVRAVEWVQAALARYDDDFLCTDTTGRARFLNRPTGPFTGWNQLCHPVAGSLEPLRLRDVMAIVADAGPSTRVRRSFKGRSKQNGNIVGTKLLPGDLKKSRPANGGLRQREEQFRALAACAPAGILQMDPAGHCVYANCSGQLLGGFSAEECRGEGWARFLHWHDRARVAPAWVAAMQAGKEFGCEFRFQTPEPCGRWVRLRSSPMVSDLGKLIGHVAVLQDIDDQKLAEEALRETRTLLSAVAQTLRQCQARQQSENS
jgi:PAS domain S-box-containing protein